MVHDRPDVFVGLLSVWVLIRVSCEDCDPGEKQRRAHGPFELVLRYSLSCLTPELIRDDTLPGLILSGASRLEVICLLFV